MTARRSPIPAPSARYRRWTAEELRQLWKHRRKGIAWNAVALGRSVAAVLAKTRALTPPEGLDEQSLLDVAHETGYGPRRLKAAAEWLGLRLARPGCGVGKATVFRITGEQKTKLLDFLAAQPDGTPLLRPSSKLTPAAAWGTGTKPPSCIDCGTTDRPHRCAGRCGRCHDKRKGVWGVDGKPAACVGCARSSARHLTADRCATCWRTLRHGEPPRRRRRGPVPGSPQVRRLPVAKRRAA